MKSYIAALAYGLAPNRMTISVGLDEKDELRALFHDGVRSPGLFVPTYYGWLYQHSDGQFGLPGLGYGSHPITVRKALIGATDGKTSNIVATVFVPSPPSSLGTEKISPVALLGHLWDAGFRTAQELLNVVSIARGESGFYVKARNWLPGTGFRPRAELIGVQGPAAAWNADHTQQGHSDRGLFQFNSKAWPKTPDSVTDDPAAVCKTVYTISKGSSGFKPWGHGAGVAYYERFWPEMKPFVDAFVALK